MNRRLQVAVSLIAFEYLRHWNYFLAALEIKNYSAYSKKDRNHE